MNDIQNASILMMIFSAALFVYALILYLTGDSKLIMFDYAAKMKDKKAYAKRFAGIIALVALAVLVGGLVGLLTESGKLLFRFLIGGMVLAIAIGVDQMKKLNK